MTAEMFDVCDEHDHVIGQRSREEVHARQLLHRAVHVWVWNSAGELLLQLRSATKDQYPGCYTSSASGHVDAGEDYHAAAIRELREELQLQGDLVWGMKLPAAAKTAFEHTVLYHLQSDTPPVPDPVEIAELYFFPAPAVVAMLARTPEQFTPPFRELFREWWANPVRQSDY